MNWITKAINFGQKIKKFLKKGNKKKILKTLIGLAAVKAQYLKKI